MQIHASMDFSGLMALMAGYLSPGFCDCPHFGSFIQSQFFTATRLAFFSALAASSNKAFYKYMEPNYHQLEMDTRIYMTYVDCVGVLY
jgi:hypothetical protein